MSSLKKRKIPFVFWVLLGIGLGVVLGWKFPQWKSHYSDVSALFIRAIKMLVAPLIFSSLVVGLCSTGGKRAGRLLGKALLWFWLATSVALFIGLGAANIVKPGVNAIEVKGEYQKPVPKPWVEQIVPDSVVKAMAENAVLPLVVFSVLFGLGLSTIGDKGLPLVALLQAISEAMFKVTAYVMYLVPLGVAGAVANAISKQGFGVFRNLIKLVGALYGALLVFSVILVLAVKLITRVKMRRVFGEIKGALLLAFSSASSETVLPSVMQSMEKLGVPSRIVRLVIPTGYSFNLDGTTLYLSLAALFIVQAMGKPMPVASQLWLMLSLLIASKGVAAVPRASLLVLASVCTQFDLRADWILTILAVDTFMDMARTSINVLGNCLATLVVARWEKELPPDALCLQP